MLIPLPMEFADGKTRLTHFVAALSITDQQEADKLQEADKMISRRQIRH
jgi:hypothetical protein